MKKIITLFFLLAALVFNSITVTAAERIPGTRISLSPPPEFVKARQFPGYLMNSTGSSIMVTDVAGVPFSDFSSKLDAAGFATQGMTLLGKESPALGSRSTILFHASQHAYGQKYLKWMLVLGDDSGSSMIVATFPAQLEDRMSSQMKQAVLSARYSHSTDIDLFEGLTFQVTESGKLKFAKRIGNTILLTEQGIFPEPRKGAPLVIVGSSITQDWSPTSDLKQYARGRLTQTQVLAEPEITTEFDVEIDGLQGYMIYAKGIDKDTGGTLYIEQCMLLTHDGYYMFQAMADNGEAEALKADFRKILYSFKRAG